MKKQKILQRVSVILLAVLALGVVSVSFGGASCGGETATINYSGNGHTSGTVPTSQNVTTPGSITLKQPGTLARTGFRFGGWRDSNTIRAAGSTITWDTATSETRTLNATWVSASQRDTARHITEWYSTARIPLKTFEIATSLDDATWRYGMQQSVNNWNNSSANITFAVSATAPHQVRAKPSIYAWVGAVFPYDVSGAELKSFDIELNSRTIANEAIANGNSLGSTITYVFLHELGHVLGLCDDPTTTQGQNTIMKWLTKLITVPPTYDISSVNALYR